MSDARMHSSDEDSDEEDFSGSDGTLDSEERAGLREMGQRFGEQDMQEALMAAGFDGESDFEDFIEEGPAAGGARRSGWRGYRHSRDRPSGDIHTEWFLSCFGLEGALAERKAIHVIETLHDFSLPVPPIEHAGSLWLSLWCTVVGRNLANLVTLLPLMSKLSDPSGICPAEPTFAVHECNEAQRAGIRRGMLYDIRDAQCALEACVACVH